MTFEPQGNDWPTHPAADLFPLLQGAELAELADDIREHGLIEPVWLYDDPERGTVLLDGRNRRAAVELAGVELETRFYEGDDPIGFSISQNMKRRHLTNGQKAAVAFSALPLYKEEGRRKMAEAVAEENRRRAEQRQQELEEADRREREAAESGIVVDHPGGADLPHLGDPQLEEENPAPSIPAPGPSFLEFRPPPERAPRARDRAATVAGTSGRAVAQFKRVTEEAPDLAEKVRDGSIALDRAERIIRDREAEQRRVEQARSEAHAIEEELRVDLRHGDFREVLAEITGVDAIITDPPYPFEFLPLLDDLARWADKVLTPDGVLAVLMGQTHLPDVYRRLDGHRPYRWTAAYLTPGNGYVSWPRKVQSNWKPVIFYGGGPRFADVIRSEGSDANAKSLHKWGQDYNAFHTLVERVTTRGQTVADPFMGSGTTLLAAHALGRHVIGCDIEEESVRTSRERLL